MTCMLFTQSLQFILLDPTICDRLHCLETPRQPQDMPGTCGPWDFLHTVYSYAS